MCYLCSSAPSLAASSELWVLFLDCVSVGALGKLDILPPHLGTFRCGAAAAAAQHCAPWAQGDPGWMWSSGPRCSHVSCFSLVPLTVWLSVQYSLFIPEPFVAGVENQEQF